MPVSAPQARITWSLFDSVLYPSKCPFSTRLELVIGLPRPATLPKLHHDLPRLLELHSALHRENRGAWGFLDFCSYFGAQLSWSFSARCSTGAGTRAQEAFCRVQSAQRTGHPPLRGLNGGRVAGRRAGVAETGTRVGTPLHTSAQNCPPKPPKKQSAGHPPGRRA